MTVAGRPALTLFYGGGDMLEAVDDLRSRTERGEVEGIVIAAASADNSCGWFWAWKGHTDAIWARMTAAVAAALHELLDRGL